MLEMVRELGVERMLIDRQEPGLDNAQAKQTPTAAGHLWDRRSGPVFCLRIPTVVFSLLTREGQLLFVLVCLQDLDNRKLSRMK